MDGVVPALAIGFASSLTQLAAIAYFLSAVGSFKPKLKMAYVILSTGLFLFSFVQLVPSLSAFTDIVSRSLVVTDFFFIVPYACGALLMYLGVRTFARLLEVRFFWNSIIYSTLFGLAVAAVVVLAPHPALPDLGLPFALVFGALAWSAAFSVVAFLVTLRIERVISPSYKSAMRWMVLAFAALAFSSFHEIIVKVYFITSGYVSTSLSMWPFLLVGVLMLRAGMGFKWANQREISWPANASYVDVVVNAAGLVSKPEAVDVTLDKVRAITAAHGSADVDLSPQEKATLVDAYLTIEHYLTAEDPLHTFTQEGLRTRLPAQFAEALSKEG